MAAAGATADGADADGTPRQPSRRATPRTGRRPGAGRRAARSARVRRRRRVLAVIGGGLLIVILAFVLWYELESHALGPAGPQVVVTVHQGESTDSIVNSLSQQGVIGSSLAFQVSEVFHGTPTVLPGSYALHQNLSLLRGRARSWPPGRTSTRSTSVPASRSPRWRRRSTACPGHSGGEFAKTAASGAVHSMFSPPGSNNLEGMLGTGNYLVLPGRDRHHHPDRHGAALRPRRAGGRPHHGVGGRTGYDAVPGAHRRLHRGEGGVRTRSTCPTRPGSSTTGWPRAPRCRWTRPCCTHSGRTGDR